MVIINANIHIINELLFYLIYFLLEEQHYK